MKCQIFHPLKTLRILRVPKDLYIEMNVFYLFNFGVKYDLGTFISLNIFVCTKCLQHKITDNQY